MGEKLSKEQIQEEYTKLVSMLGEKVYRFALPFLEILPMAQRLLYLNQQMHMLLSAEAEKNKQPSEAPSAA